MGNLLTTDAELQAVANAIRSKGGTSAALGYPNGMVNAIGALNVGTGLNPAATAADIRNGKKAVVNRTTLTGSMTEKAAATYNTSSSDQTISANQFLTGAQTIRAVTTANIEAGNIKKNVVVKVGDANNAGRIKNVTGTLDILNNRIRAYFKAIENVTVGTEYSAYSVRCKLKVTDGTLLDTCKYILIRKASPDPGHHIEEVGIGYPEFGNNASFYVYASNIGRTYWINEGADLADVWLDQIYW